MYYDYYAFIPRIPNTNEKPPTIYAILNAYCNGESDLFLEESYVKPTELAKKGREAIFDFSYPLTENLKKEDFEELILNKFMMRRIGYETLPAFKIALFSKLNEIMPKYNKMFDALINWNIFTDGEEENRNYSESRIDNGTSTNNSSSETKTTSDRRFSDTPQNRLNDIKDGSYVTDYNFDTDENNITSDNIGTSSTNGNTNIVETIKRSPANKMEVYKNMMELDNIYTLIFKDLSKLFYALV